MSNLASRLLAKRDFVGACWVFSGSKDRCGYGRISVQGINTPAHRAAWMAFRGDPGNQHVLHNEGCVSRACFNPNHLHLGSHTQNMIERDAWGDGIRGERVGRSRLSAEDVRTIRMLRNKGYIWRVIADMFGVHPSTARHAATGRSWNHI